MFKKIRRKMAGFLTVIMLVGQVMSGSTGIAFAGIGQGDAALPAATSSDAPTSDGILSDELHSDRTDWDKPVSVATPSDEEDQSIGQIFVQIKEAEVNAALRAGKNGADALRLDLIPFAGEKKRQVYGALKEAMDGRRLVRQKLLGGGNRDCMYLITVTEDTDGVNNSRLADRIDLIVLNASPENDYEFHIQVTGKERNILRAGVTCYDMDWEADADSFGETWLDSLGMEIELTEDEILALQGKRVPEENQLPPVATPSSPHRNVGAQKIGYGLYVSEGITLLSVLSENGQNVYDHEWGIELSLRQTGSGDFYEVREENGRKKLVVLYGISLGLVSQREADGSVRLAPAGDVSYQREGGAPFESFEIVQMPGALGKEGEVKPESFQIWRLKNGQKDGELLENPITVYNTQGSNGLGEAQASDEAPFYTEYLVEAVYPYEAFEVGIGDKVAEEEILFPITNTAVLSYALKGGEPDSMDEEEELQVRFLKEWAEIDVSAFIRLPKTTGGYEEKPYGSELGTVFKGYEEFAILRKGKDGRYLRYLEAMMQLPDGSGGVIYEKLEDGIGYINPAEDGNDKNKPVIGTDGSVKLFVEPGTYRITGRTEETGFLTMPEYVEVAERESGYPDEVTAAAGDQRKVRLVSEAPHMGGLQFKKTDTEGGALSGAEFGLWEGTNILGEPMMTAVSGITGSVCFYPLKEGTTYTVQEIKAPAGYLLNETFLSYMAEGNRYGTIFEKEVAGRKNEGTLTVETFLKTGNEYEKLGAYPAFIADFEGAFELQKRLSGDEAWETVQTLSPGSAGISRTKAELYSLDPSGKIEGPWEYRVVETIPENYTSETIAGEQVFQEEKGIVSSAGCFFDVSAKETGIAAGTALLSLKNMVKGSLGLKVNGSSLNKEGNWRTAAQGGKTFWLYRKASGENGYERVSLRRAGAMENQWTTDSSGRIQIDGLVVCDADNRKYEYFWYEADGAENEVLYGDKGEVVAKNLPDTGKEEARLIGPYSIAYYGEPQVTAEVVNVLQEYPVWIERTDKITGNRIFGDAFALYEIENGRLGELVVENVGGNGTSAVLLPTGKRYAVVETKTPEGYYGFDGGKIILDQENKTYRCLEVDLTEKTIMPEMMAGRKTTFSAGSRGVLKEEGLVSFENTPMPSLGVKMWLLRTGTGREPEDLSDPKASMTVSFDVYGRKQAENGPDESDKSVVIKGVPYYWTGTVTTGGGEPLVLEAGTYYLRERWTNPEASGRINPDLMDLNDPNLHAPILGDSAESELIKTDDGKTFWEVTLKVPESEKDLLTLGTVFNYENKGIVQAQKVHGWDEKTGLVGAVAEIYVRSDDTGDPVAQVESNSEGFFISEALAIYDAGNTEILYTIKEVESPEGYWLDDSIHSFTLDEKEIKTLNEEGDPIVFNGNPKLTVSVKTEGKNRWESEFYPIQYELPGIWLALLYQDESGNVVPVLNENEDPVVKATSRDLAQVSFGDLSEEETYYIAQIYEPGNGYSVPVGRKSLREDTSEGKTLEDVKSDVKDFQVKREDFISQYYFSTFNGNSIKEDDKTAKKTEYTLEPLSNEKNWIQFQIDLTAEYEVESVTKEDYEKLSEDERLTITANGTTTYYKKTKLDKEEPLDGARFELYAQDSAYFDGKSELKFNPSADLEKLGTYESGAVLNENGEPISGKMKTDVFNDTTKVYWLIQVKAPMGGVIDPDESTVAFVPEKLSDLTKEGCQMEVYEKDVAEAQFHNYTEDKTESGYYARLKLNVWKGEENGNGFDAFGGVKFQLKLKDYDFVLEQLVTGLENSFDNFSNGITASAATGYLNFDEWKKTFTQWLESEKGMSKEEANKISGRVFDESTHQLDCQLVAVYVPQKAELDQKKYEVTLEFYSINELVINDDYFYYEENGEGKNTRITVDILENYPAKIHAAGYRAYDEILELEPTDEILRKKMEAGQLPETVFLSNVQMELQKIDEETGEWKSYGEDAEGNVPLVIKTSDKGVYSFEKGLVMGDYRLLEKSLGDDRDQFDYYNMYPGTDEETYKYFTVGETGADVYLFNPRKPNLEITKTALSGGTAALGEVTFCLNGAGLLESTDAEGKAIFENLDPGSYTITETKGNGDLSNIYFDDYYGEAARTISLGYERVFDEEKKEAYLKVFEEHAPVAEVGQDGNAKLTFANPRTAGLEILVKDGETKDPLAGAEFEYSFAPFTSDDWTSDGEGNLSLNAGIVGEEYLEKVESREYTKQIETLTTDENGTVSKGQLVPGWYKLEEIKAPEGYEPYPKPFYVAVRSDMEKRVDGTYSYVPYERAELENRKMVRIEAVKVLDYGELDLTEISSAMEGDLCPGEVTFEIFKGATPVQAESTGIRHTFRAADFKKHGNLVETAAKELSQKLPQLLEGDTHYYLKETVQTQGKPRQKWYFSSAAVRAEGNEEEIRPLADGMIRLDSNGDSGSFRGKNPVTVRVTNKIGMAQIKLKTVCSMVETEALSGAEFGVYEALNSDGTPMGSPLASGVTGKGGILVLSVWLGELTDGTDKLYLAQTKAPASYEPVKAAVALSLSPGEVASFADADRPELTIKNVPVLETGTVTFRKTDKDTGEDLQGARFRLTWSYDGKASEGISETVAKVVWSAYAERFVAGQTMAQGLSGMVVEDESSITFRTDGTGTIILGDLPYGTYRLKETEAPEGYILGEYPWSADFTISRQKKQIWLQGNQPDSDGSVTNAPHRLTVKKISSVDDTARLAGASFILQAADGRYVVLKKGVFDGWTADEEMAGVITTDADGRAEVKKLPAGRYMLIETIAPPGYEIREEIPTFLVGDIHTEILVADTPIRNAGGGGTKGQGTQGTQLSSGGTWILDSNVWRYRRMGGTYLRACWQQILYRGTTEWYYFDDRGYMWTGWFKDADGKIYYLHPVADGTRGRMYTGWNFIDGKWYYFNPISDGTKGALFVNRRTPDGYWVDENGVWKP